MHGERRVLEDEPSFAAAAAHWIADRIAETDAARGRCTIALSGGRTPRPVYEALARPPFAARVPWERVEVYFSDERCVPPDDARSNYRMARESLLAHVPIPAARVHRMRGEMSDRAAAARSYEAELPEALDVLLLGMGADGHTASLFPGSSVLGERARRVVAVRGPKAPPWRLTITPPVIASARTVAVLVSGAEKADVAARALNDPVRPQELPIQLALHGVWFMDASAASRWREERGT